MNNFGKKNIKPLSESLLLNTKDILQVTSNQEKQKGSQNSLSKKLKNTQNTGYV